MTTIVPVLTKENYKITASIAKTIWIEHYTPIIGEQQVAYMLDKFQSAIAIEDQVKNGSMYYLLLYKESPVGYFSFCIKEGFLFLSKLYVLHTARGNRIGKTALLFMEEKVKEFGFNKIQLTVNKFNTDSIKAYEKMGFINCKAIIQDIGNGYVMDDYVLEKTIR